MKKGITIILLLIPSFAFAQTIPFPQFPDVVYCTDVDLVPGTVYVLNPQMFPDPDNIYRYFNTFLMPPANSNWFYAESGDAWDNNTGLSTDCQWDGINPPPSLSTLVSQGKAFYFVRSASPKVLPDEVALRKSADESIANITTLHNDSQLSVAMKNGKSYIVKGVVFASATNATPDIKVAFTAPTGSDVTIGYTATAGAGSTGELQASGAASTRIPLPANTRVPIHIEGTVVAGADGALHLQWAQFVSNAATLTVGKGSYLKVEEIQ